ncbi:MAG: type I DNA topoisomerase [Clostridiales bacterium]|nr:type I DNA topoisomerase [Clostridiales bacterium]
MDLIIVESPSKAKTISKYLKGQYKVDASAGHIRDLPVHTLGVDVQNNFEPKYVNSEGKEDIIRRLTEATKRAGRVYLATDPDREGEAIAWHLQTVLGLDEKGENRIEFNEVSQRAIEAALKTPRQINYSLVDAQQARRVLDRLVGYKLSTLLNHKIEDKNGNGKRTLSGGRVQSVALRLIVEREREITAFIPQEYWNLTAELQDIPKKYAPFKAMLEKKGTRKYKPASAEETAQVLSQIESGKFIVSKVKKTIAKSHAPAPFTTSSLQQDASTKLGFTAPETMTLAQHLYEGIETESGDHIAFITYMRTDSVRVAKEAQMKALERIRTVYGEEYAPEKPNYYASKKGAQDAHEAIRPIDLEMTPEKAKKLLDKKHYSLYKLVYERFLASQMSEARYNSMQMEIDNSGYIFKASGKVLLFAGFTAIYQDVSAKKDDEDEISSAKLLPDLNEGDVLDLISMLKEQKFTKPPLRYTDASLVKTMEEKGIGRPSTYATIISKLMQKYVKKEGKYMVPAPIAYDVVDMLVKCFVDVMDVGFTAGMENKLDNIEEGDIDWRSVVGEFYPGFERNLREASSYGDELTEVTCGKCGHFMIRRMGKFGKYLACSNYPECQNILSETKEEISSVRCPKCGENMVVKSGKFGRFLACPSYPDCKSTMSMPSDEEPKLVGKCPECGAAMTVRKSKKGKVYYSCLGYPDCKFMSWDVPTGEKCPECNAPLVQTARGNVKCNNKDCSYRLKTEKEAKTEKKAKDFVPQLEDDFTPPPLMDEPRYTGYEDDDTAYFPEGIDE